MSGKPAEPNGIGPKLEEKANPAGRANVVEVGEVEIAGLDKRGYVGFKILRFELASELWNANMVRGTTFFKNRVGGLTFSLSWCLKLAPCLRVRVC